MLLLEVILFLFSNFSFLSHIQIFSCEISLIYRLKYPYYCFSACFCFLVIVVLLILMLFVMYWSLLLGRSNGQRELNPFLFQAELPPPFWPLLFWVLVWIHENGTRTARDHVWQREPSMTLKFLETNVELIYLFPRELWHTAQPILINVLCTIQYVFVLVNKCSNQVNCEYSIHFHYYVCHRCVIHPPTHTIFV